MAAAALEVVPTPPESNPALDAFSDELAKRFPDLVVKRFVFPKNVRHAREIFLREIDGKDEIAAAAMADGTMSPLEKASNKLAADAERRESIRIAIVGIGERVGGKRAAEDAPIAYRHVNNDGVPFTAINTWPINAWACLYAYNGEINGVPMAELVQGITEARTVGAFAPPTNATPASEGLAK